MMVKNGLNCVLIIPAWIAYVSMLFHGKICHHPLTGVLREIALCFYAYIS